MFNTKVELPHATSFVNILCGHKFNSRGLRCLLWKKKPSLDRNVDSEKLRTFSRKFSNIDFFYETFTIKR